MCSSRFLVLYSMRVLSLVPVYVGISCIRVLTSGMRRASSWKGRDEGRGERGMGGERNGGRPEGWRGRDGGRKEGQYND